MKVFILLTLVVASSLARPGDSKVDSNLQNILTSGQNANIFVKFSQGTAQVLEKIAATRFSNREERLKTLGAALEENAVISQAKVKSFLDQLQSFPYKSFWITNQIYIEHADASLVSTLEKFAEVQKITEEVIIPLVKPKLVGPVAQKIVPLIGWGMEKIQAVEAYDLLRNVSTNTKEIRVATIDTGVRGTHESLRDNFLGAYGWYDPYEKTESPNDGNGLGTHGMGILTGKGGIGVYPDAKWMSCKGCNVVSCSQAALLECSEYITCPFLADGTARDCTKAPHLVSNSWGGGDSSWFNPVITIWQEARIVPIFSVGGSGPECGTISSPADSEGVIGVGSSTETEGTSNGGVGPTKDGRIKPDITAPGSAESAYNTADDAYATLTGTVIGCPFVAGLTSVLLAYDDQLSYPQVQEFLFTGAETEPLQSTGRVCSDDGDNVFPNNVYGYGRINVLFSLRKAIEAASK